MYEEKSKKLIEVADLSAARGYRQLFANVSFDLEAGNIL